MKASIILALAGTSMAIPFGGFFDALFGGSSDDSAASFPSGFPSGLPSGIFPPGGEAPYPTGTGTGLPFGTGRPSPSGVPEYQLLNARDRSHRHHPHPTGGAFPFPTGGFPRPTGIPGNYPRPTGLPAGLKVREAAPYPFPTISGPAPAGTDGARPHRPHGRPHHRPSGDVGGFAYPTGRPGSFPGGEKPSGFATHTRGPKPTPVGEPSE